MAEVEIQMGLQENTVGMVERFVDIAAADPISAVLILMGALLVTVSAGLFGLLTVGALGGSLKRRLPSGGGPPRQAQ